MASTINWIHGLQTDIELDELNELEGYFSDSDPLEVDESKIHVHSAQDRFNRMIIVDNVPVVPTDKLEKLRNMLRKVFGACGTIESGFPTKNDDGIYTPVETDANNVELSTGFAFITYKTPAEALQAVKVLNNHYLDSKHTFLVNLYTDAFKYENWPDEYVEPEMPSLTDKSLAKGNKWAWLLDEAGRDQFSVRFGRNTEIYWCEGLGHDAEVSLAYDGEREKMAGKIWCENYTSWSCHGSYFATFHKQGIALWTGGEFTKFARYAHPGVTSVLFSPDKEEKRMLTWNGVADGNDNRALILWDVENGKELRTFSVAKGSVWPFMTFSHNGQYFARMVVDGIAIYSSDDARMLEKKPIPTKGIAQVQWSPGELKIAYWAPEVGNQPARVVIIDPVTRTEVRSLHLFHVRDVKLHWQNQGDYLCAQVLRHSKSGKTTFTNLEFFQLKLQNIPNETMSLQTEVLNFQWEPFGKICAVVQVNSETKKNSVVFYEISASKLEEVFSIDTRLVEISWSPLGSYCALSNFPGNEPAIEFYDVSEKQMLGDGEHHTAKRVVWDPSGRLAVTVASQNLYGPVTTRDQLENGYYVWNFQGELLQKIGLQELFQFEWRPRPSWFVSVEDRNEVKRDLKKHVKRYTKIDELKKARTALVENAEKLKSLKLYRTLMKKKLEEGSLYWKNRKAKGLFESFENDNEMQLVEEFSEEVVSEKAEKF